MSGNGSGSSLVWEDKSQKKELSPKKQEVEREKGAKETQDIPYIIRI